MSAPRHVVITGASGGMGRLITSMLLEQGDLVLAVVRGGAARALQYWPPQPGLQVLDLTADAHCDLEALRAAIQGHLAGHVDVLINAAGYGLLGPIELQTPDSIRDLMQVNFVWPLMMIQACLPYLRQRAGRIINITSMAAGTVFPFYGTYAASKAALKMASEALIYELRDFQVQVTSVEPGAYKTGFQLAVQVPAAASGESRHYAARLHRFQAFVQWVQRKMEKDPAAVARLVLRLCRQRRLKPRYLVGSDAIFNTVLRSLVPDFVYVPIQSWVYRRFLF